MVYIESFSLGIMKFPISSNPPKPVSVYPTIMIKNTPNLVALKTIYNPKLLREQLFLISNILCWNLESFGFPITVQFWNHWTFCIASTSSGISEENKYLQFKIKKFYESYKKFSSLCLS